MACLRATTGRVLAVVCAVVWLVGWGSLVSAAVAQVYFEPTDEAVAHAEASLRGGYIGAATVVVTALTAAAALQRWWIAVAVLPGAVGGLLLAERPDSHGLPLLGLFIASAAVLVVAVFRVVRRSAP